VSSYCRTPFRAFNGGRKRLFLWQTAGTASPSAFHFVEAEVILDPDMAHGATNHSHRLRFR
jgi:hypothetical protein